MDWKKKRLSFHWNSFTFLTEVQDQTKTTLTSAALRWLRWWASCRTVSPGSITHSLPFPEGEETEEIGLSNFTRKQHLLVITVRCLMFNVPLGVIRCAVKNDQLSSNWSENYYLFNALNLSLCLCDIDWLIEKFNTFFWITTNFLKWPSPFLKPQKSTKHPLVVTYLTARQMQSCVTLFVRQAQVCVAQQHLWKKRNEKKKSRGSVHKHTTEAQST